MSSDLTHLDSNGNLRMVDVGQKSDSDRIAIAFGEIILRKDTLDLIIKDEIKKGNVLAAAELAGIMAAKKTSDLIPLCHPISLTQISVTLGINENLPGIEIKATVRTTGKTGVEMEALTAVSISALTIYDMVKAVQKDVIIQNIHLLEKAGGKSGEWKYEG
jgi:cyclic pyranopterin phosphate synthase